MRKVAPARGTEDEEGGGARVIRQGLRCFQQKGWHNSLSTCSIDAVITLSIQGIQEDLWWPNREQSVKRERYIKCEGMILTSVSGEIFK